MSGYILLENILLVWVLFMMCFVSFVLFLADCIFCSTNKKSNFLHESDYLSINYYFLEFKSHVVTSFFLYATADIWSPNLFSLPVKHVSIIKALEKEKSPPPIYFSIHQHNVLSEFVNSLLINMTCGNELWWKCRGPETGYTCGLADTLTQSLHLL